MQYTKTLTKLCILLAGILLSSLVQATEYNLHFQELDSDDNPEKDRYANLRLSRERIVSDVINSELKIHAYQDRASIIPSTGLDQVITISIEAALSDLRNMFVQAENPYSNDIVPIVANGSPHREVRRMNFNSPVEYPALDRLYHIPNAPTGIIPVAFTAAIYPSINSSTERSYMHLTPAQGITIRTSSIRIPVRYVNETHIELDTTDTNDPRPDLIALFQLEGRSTLRMEQRAEQPDENRRETFDDNACSFMLDACNFSPAAQ